MSIKGELAGLQAILYILLLHLSIHPSIQPEDGLILLSLSSFLPFRGGVALLKPDCPKKRLPILSVSRPLLLSHFFRLVTQSAQIPQQPFSSTHCEGMGTGRSNGESESSTRIFHGPPLLVSLSPKGKWSEPQAQNSGTRRLRLRLRLRQRRRL